MPPTLIMLLHHEASYLRQRAFGAYEITGVGNRNLQTLPGIASNSQISLL